jgi:PAN domain
MAGLGIGRTIRRKGFVTVVPPAAECASACALAWLGGSQRYMGDNARIGFHEAYFMSFGRPRRSDDAEAAVVDYLEQLQLPPRAISYMTSSPASGLNMLTAGRARDLGVAVNSYEADETTGSIDQTPATAAPAIERLPQVDLYGRNLPDMPIEASTADECEAQCRADQNCAAFTFNPVHSACFLKASVELAVSYPSAVSGIREDLKQSLGQAQMSIQEATDYPGNDIGRQSGASFEACVLSCGETNACKAFTYVVQRHECWLKDGAGSAEVRDGLISGIK